MLTFCGVTMRVLEDERSLTLQPQGIDEGMAGSGSSPVLPVEVSARTYMDWALTFVHILSLSLCKCTSDIIREMWTHNAYWEDERCHRAESINSQHITPNPCIYNSS
jgi:hypothetical protein